MSTVLSSLGKKILLYGGIAVLAFGIAGALLNILVFLSLKTFRQSSCALYLIAMSIANLGQFAFGFSSRLMLVALGFDGTDNSIVYCKLRQNLFQICMATSMTCMCLATIDQYCATCSRPRWQQFCNIKLAYRLVVITVVIWFLHGIPYFIYYNPVTSSTTNKTTCTVTDPVYAQYRTIGLLIVIIGYFPVSVAALFGSMAYCNVKELAYRTVPLVRRELDKQLTVMVLTQVIVDVFTGLPYVTINAVITNIKIVGDLIAQDQLQFASYITLLMYYVYVASPFYIYICASERFRRQLIYVLFRLYLIPCKQSLRAANQVVPEA